MKRFIAVLILTIINITTVFALPSPTNEFYVADYANLLSDNTKQYIVNNSNALYNSTDAQIVVATVDTIDGQNEREYGIELARSWGIGGKSKNNGLLILLALQERKITVEVGYGLEGALPDSKTGRFLDQYAVEHLSMGDYDTGIRNLYSAILAETYNEYGLSVPDSVEDVSVYNEGSSEESDGTGEFIVLIVVVVLYILIHKNGGGTNHRRSTMFITPTGFGGHSGGFHGGGGGGFRGGGGSFGGGGSSRGF